MLYGSVIRLGMNSALCLLILTSTVSYVQSQGRSPIRLINNGYENILIAIRSDVPENEGLVDAIKDYFTQASAVLYRATKNAVYLRNITIFLPETWKKFPAVEPSSNETFSKANIIIADAPNQPDAGPSTHQKSGCGIAGDYIHIPPRYLLDRNFAEYAYGPVGKTLVHEWGHLRWGLLNEHPGDDYPHCVVEDGKLLPVTCSQGMDVAVLHDPTGRYGCQVIPKTHKQPAQASIMYAPHLDSVYTFCDRFDHPDVNVAHNAFVANKHNVLCSGLSAWEIMRQHEDFAGGSNKAQEIIDTKPNFRLVQCKDVKIALILDVSGSMSGVKINSLHSAAEEYIRGFIPLNTHVIIIQFSSVARVLHDVIKITSDKERESLVAALPTRANGGTCIGCGINVGIQKIKSRFGGNIGGTVFTVITDGDESNNLHPTIADVTDEVISSGVTVNAILFTDSADITLKTLSDKTHGVSMFVGQSGQTSEAKELYKSFKATKPCQIDDATGEEFELESKQTKGERCGKLQVDSSATKNTKFVFMWDSKSHSVTVTLTLPSGTAITDGNPFYRKKSTSVIVTLPKSEVGEYTYCLERTPSGADFAVGVSVFGSSHRADALSLKTAVSTDKLNTEGVVIYGELRKGYNVPVLGARVEASIKGPKETYKLRLKDNGAGVDFTKDDGIYSGFFGGFVDRGKYTIDVEAKADKGEAKIKTVRSTLVTGAIPLNFYNRTLEENITDAEPFSRNAQAPFINVQNPISTAQDVIKPSRVTDLKVVNASSADWSFCVTWTAVGDDYDVGNASFYDMRFNDNMEKLKSNFTLCDSVPVKLSRPLPPDSEEMLCAQIPAATTKKTYFVALTVGDERNNTSPVSNIARVSFIKIDSFRLPGDTRGPTDASAVIATPSAYLSLIIALLIFNLFHILYSE